MLAINRLVQASHVLYPVWVLFEGSVTFSFVRLPTNTDKMSVLQAIHPVCVLSEVSVT